VIRVFWLIMRENKVGLISGFVAQPVRWADALVGGRANKKHCLTFAAAPPFALVQRVFGPVMRYRVMKPRDTRIGSVRLMRPTGLANPSRPTFVEGTEQARTLSAAKPTKSILWIFGNVVR
jgi:hypothetical protein